MDTLTNSELWGALPAEERLRACLAIWRSKDVSGPVRADILLALAKALHFREKSLKAQPDTKKAHWLLAQSGQPDFRRFHGDLVGALLLTEHAEMIEAFLEVQGIPHRGCFLEEAGDKLPTAESLCQGIRNIRQTWGDWSTCLYLGFTLAQGEDPHWSALPAAIAAEGLNIRQTLQAPVTPDGCPTRI